MFSYLYDFGDRWEHILTLERIIKEDEFITGLSKEEDFHIAKESLMCLDGQRACPPEDVGGGLGYQEFCEAMAST